MPVLRFVFVLPALLALTACDEPPEPGSDAARGAALMAEVGCGACHRIPGVPDAEGLAAPPLDRMAQRKFIAGMLRNTPSNMVTWLMDPQEVVPGNAMPDAGLSEEEAELMAAYLFTLD